MKKIFNTIIGLFTLSLLFLTGCGSAPQSGSNALSALASTSFLADIAQNVAGDRVEVKSLLPVGADAHAYQPAPSDVAKISGSDVLILNGIEYEHFMESLIENAGGERVTIIASDGLEAREMEEHAEDEDHADEAEAGEGDVHEAGDPHMWLDPNLVITFVENIRDGLIEADPEGADVYTSNAEAYIAELRALDAWIVEQVKGVPAERRLLVTNHESLGYFAERYGFEVVDTILPSFSSEASASAQEIVSAVEAIKSSGAPAIFLSEVENAKMANQIADETGVMVVDDLHFESLTNGSPAATYLDMMRHNVSRIVDALK
jgi:ABC-type Zn uptake system ZnuABC Zn-binding protein ZnuA